MYEESAKIPSARARKTADATVLVAFLKAHRTYGYAPSGIVVRLEYVVAWEAAKLLHGDGSDETREFACINGYWDREKEESVMLSEINIGFAVDTPRALVVPVVHNTEKLSFAEFALRAEEQVQKAREGKTGFDDFRDLTFTVNNTGILGDEDSDPIIPSTFSTGKNIRPTTMILALPEMRKEGEKILLPLVVRFDHRQINRGGTVLRFLKAIKERIEEKKSAEDFTRALFAK